jgi:hypothetical protein
MILNVEYKGSKFKWIEKNSRACLIKDEGDLLWWGDPDDAVEASTVAPVAVLLELSILRNMALDQVEEPSYTS